METQSLKTVFFESEDYKLEIEPFADMVFLHCVVHRWTVSSLKHGYAKFGELMNQMAQQGYPKLITITPNPKFAQLFAGDVVDKFSYNNENYEVVEWDLTQLAGR